MIAAVLAVFGAVASVTGLVQTRRADWQRAALWFAVATVAMSLALVVERAP